MNGVIYYFTGRGNSLKTAMALSEKLGNCLISPIRHDTKPADEEADVVGFICPVIDYGIPAYVLAFIDKLPALKKETYIFAVAVNGGMPCDALHQIRSRLQKHKLKLSAEFQLKYGKGWHTSNVWRDEIGHIAQAIENRQEERSITTLKDRLLTGALNPLAKMIIPSQDKKFLVSDKCTGCGTCERICPANDIVIENNRPVWKHRCEQCAACCSWCPQAAIGGSNLAAEGHYTNQEITLVQMLRGQS